MRTPRPAHLATLLCAMQLGLHAAPKVQTEWLPVVRLAPSQAAPSIDGRLDDVAWKSAYVTDAFVGQAGEKAELTTRARVLHDGQTLYLAFDCQDPDVANLKTAATKRDGDVWLDDSVEVFVDANWDFKTYHHLLINAANVQRDEAGDLGGTPSYDAGWNATWQSATARTDHGWTAEMAIPLSAVGIDLQRDVAIGLNLCRNAIGAGESTCWSPTHDGFHNPHRFATVILATKPEAPRLDVEISDVGQPKPKQASEVTGTVANRSNQTIDLEADVRTSSRQGMQRDTEYLGSLPPGEGDSGSLPYQVRDVGPNSLGVLLRDQASGAILYAGHLSIEVPILMDQAFGARLPSPAWCDAWWADGMDKVQPDREAPDAHGERVELSCAGNEAEAFQLVLTSRQARQVRLEPSPLRGEAGTVGQGALELFRVEHVPVTRPSDAFGSPGLYPDPLLPIDGAISVGPERNTVVWVRVDVPKGTAGGDYDGAVRLVNEAGQSFDLPLRLHVFGFSLSDETHTKTAYGMGPVWSFLGLSERGQQEQVFEKYLAAFRDHRLSPYDPFAFHPIRYELHGPEWRISTGPLELVLNEYEGRYFSLYDHGTKVGELTNTIDQFEKEGVGYQGTGVGWPGIDRLKEVKVVERSPRRWVLEVTGEHTGSGPAARRYEITFRFTLLAGRSQLIAECLRFKNSDTERFQWRGYFYILHPAAEATKGHAGPLANGYWLMPDGHVLGGVAVGGDASFSLEPIFVQQPVWVEPGQTVPGHGPKLVIYTGQAAQAEPAKTSMGIATHLAEVLQEGGVEALQPLPGSAITASVKDQPWLSYDFADFDRYAHKYLDEWKFNAFNYTTMPGSLGGYQRFTPEYKALHRLIFPPILAHLKQRGWLDEAYAYWFDEPNEEQYAYVNEGLDLLKQDCPGLARLLTEQVEDALVGHVNLWVPVLSNYDPGRCQAQQKQGDQVWWYVCTGPRAPYPNNFIDHPGINHRIRFWMMEKYGVQGSLYWHTTYWYDKGAVSSPWADAQQLSPEGGFWGNGDGMLLYPACREPSDTPVLDGPVISQRIELIRDGLEDREYFWTLKHRMAVAQRMLRTGRVELRQRAMLMTGLARGKLALGTPDELAASLTEYTKDPQDLLVARRSVAEAIEAFGGIGVR